MSRWHEIRGESQNDVLDGYRSWVGKHGAHTLDAAAPDPKDALACRRRMVEDADTGQWTLRFFTRV